jgi:hypothetical protein
MRLKSFGDSFVFGSDLADSVAITGKVTVPSRSTWPALLSRHLGYDYSCYARPGSGNLEILEKILNQAADSNTDLFVVSWTWIDRYDRYDHNDPRHPGKTWSNWSTIMPTDTTDTAKVYYRDLHSEYRDKFTSLSYIKLAIDTLDQKGIPFIMSYIDDLLFDQRWHTSPAVLELQSYVKDRMTQFEEQTFLDWSRKNNYLISPAWHPLEQAHQAAFELIKNQSFS